MTLFGFTIPELAGLGVAALIPVLALKVVWPMLMKDEPGTHPEIPDHYCFCSMKQGGPTCPIQCEGCKEEKEEDLEL